LRGVERGKRIMGGKKVGLVVIVSGEKRACLSSSCRNGKKKGGGVGRGGQLGAGDAGARGGKRNGICGEGGGKQTERKRVLLL